MTIQIDSIDFDTVTETAGYRVADYFNGHEWLEDGETFLDRVHASFASAELAMDWLRKSYRGADVDGIGIVVDGVPL